MKKLKSLSIFFPCYNDAKIMPYLICKTNSLAKKITHKYEIIVINDGSKDESLKILKQLTKQYKQLKIVHHKKNRGYGGALISGFTRARYEWVFYTDGDGQYDPEELLTLVKGIQKNVDVINGFKANRNDNVLRKFVGSTYNFILQKIYHLPISDIDCDFRLIRKSVIEKVELTANSGLICLELIHKLHQQGARFKEIPVSHFDRPFGVSQFFQPHHLKKTFQDHLAYYKLNKKLPNKLFNSSLAKSDRIYHAHLNS